MNDNRVEPSAAGAAVQAVLATADRWRRTREASRRVWQLAPVLAAGAAAVAVAGRWTTWPRWIPAALLAAGVVTLAAYALLARRRRAVSDAAAAAIDAHAGLGGELRSASWFARRERRDEWADYHLERAAERLAGLDWAQLYPAIRAPRARAVTVVLAASALILTMTLPQSAAHRSAAAADAAAELRAKDGAATPGLVLSPELMEQLAALLAAAEAGDATAVNQLASNAELLDLLKKLAEDPALRDAVARALANADKANKLSAEEMKAMAERARKAGEMAAMSEELREALDKLADEMEVVEAQEGDSAAAEDPMSAAGPQKGDDGQAGNPAAMQELSIQMARDADPSGGAGMMMMASPDQQGSGPPGSGVGGAGSQDAPATGAATIEALRQETIEASQDNKGDNIDTDVRRKTEHGTASTAFTQGAAGTFDKTRTAAPPPVPEARRTGVQTYFIRKPQ